MGEKQVIRDGVQEGTATTKGHLRGFMGTYYNIIFLNIYIHESSLNEITK